MSAPGPAHTRSRRLPTLVGVPLLALAYVIAANVGRLVAYDVVTPVWPPTGVALAALLLGGLRLWPGVALGELVTVAVDAQPFPPPIHLPVWAVLAMVAGNTIEAVVAAGLLRRIGGFVGSCDRVAEIGWLLVFAVALGASISATFGVAALVGVGALTLAVAPDAWFEWWVGNALGALVVSPVLTVWLTPCARRVPSTRVPELCVLLAGLAVAAAHALLGAFPSVPGAARETYLLFPFLVWSAIRFGPRVSATLVFTVAAMALGGHAWRSAGAGDLLQAGVLRVQVYIGVIAVSMLFIAALTEERHRAFERLGTLQAGLRDEVERRTAELVTANRLLHARNQALATLNEELDAFSSRVAHDLRAPVRAVAGFTAVLRESHGEALGPAGLAVLDRVTRAAERMAGLIDGLLAIARLGEHALNPRLVEMEPLVRALAENLESSGRVDVRVGALPACECDPASMEEVFENLLQNAVKYTRSVEAPRIEVGGTRTADSVVYWVRDNGVGFPMEHSPKLFRAFSRLHGAEYEGSGVGLAIVRRIVELHGGEVWAEGSVGGGATFSLRLPMPLAPRAVPV